MMIKLFVRNELHIYGTLIDTIIYRLRSSYGSYVNNGVDSVYGQRQL